MLASTTARVPSHTAAEINREIARQTERSVAYFAARPGEIERRLEELDREWDIERTLEANAAGFSLLAPRSCCGTVVCVSCRGRAHEKSRKTCEPRAASSSKLSVTVLYFR